MDGTIDHELGADLELLREALQAGLDAMRAVLTRAHEAQISTLREELEQERLKTAEAHVQIAKLTLALGDAAAALQTEKQKLEALRQSTDVLRAQLRAAWDKFVAEVAESKTRVAPAAPAPTTAQPADLTANAETASSGASIRQSVKVGGGSRDKVPPSSAADPTNLHREDAEIVAMAVEADKVSRLTMREP